MSAPKKRTEIDRHFEPRAYIARRPRLAIRQRAADHPMVMFAVFVVASFGSMALVPTAGPAFASIGTIGDPVRTTDGVQGTDKTDRLPLSAADIACRGQAWSAQTQGCLTAIAKESGAREARKVRLIASAGPNLSTPNIF